MRSYTAIFSRKLDKWCKVVESRLLEKYVLLTLEDKCPSQLTRSSYHLIEASYLKYVLIRYIRNVNKGKIIPYQNAVNLSKVTLQTMFRNQRIKYKKVKRNGNTYLIDTTKKSSKT